MFDHYGSALFQVGAYDDDLFALPVIYGDGHGIGPYVAEVICVEDEKVVGLRKRNGNADAPLRNAVLIEDTLSVEEERSDIAVHGSIVPNFDPDIRAAHFQNPLDFDLPLIFQLIRFGNGLPGLYDFPGQYWLLKV